MKPCPERRGAAVARSLRLPAVRVSVLALGLCALGALGYACGGSSSAVFALSVPPAIASQAAWYEIGLFPGGCPASATLLGGIPVQGTAGRLAFSSNTSSPPGLGSIPNQTYGIAAVARAQDCSVIATGCSSLELNSSSTLAVGVAAVSGTPAGACAAGATCQDAVCVPLPGSTSLGAGCSLAFVGGGPLADPLATPDTLSPPAVSATPEGFLIAYREFDPNAGAARLTMIPVDPGGGAGAPVHVTLPNACAASPQSDGVGLAFSSTTGTGTVAVARPPCSSTPGGVELLTVGPTGAVQETGFAGGPKTDGGTTMTSVSLGQAHALAYTPAGPVLAFTNKLTYVAFAAQLSSDTIPNKPAPARIGSLATTTSGLVIAADEGTGFIALGDSDGGSGTVVSLSLEGSADAGINPIPAPAAMPFAATWASAGGVGTRIIVATNGPSPTQRILWSAFDINGTSAGATASAGFSPQNQGEVSFADVALHQDHAFVAAEVGQDISLFAFEKASTAPILLREVAFSSQPSIPLGALKDGLVAVAASDTLVAVVWGTEQSLNADDTVGGYALFACTP